MNLKKLNLAYIISLAVASVSFIISIGLNYLMLKDNPILQGAMGEDVIKLEILDWQRPILGFIGFLPNLIFLVSVVIAVMYIRQLGKIGIKRSWCRDLTFVWIIISIIYTIVIFPNISAVIPIFIVYGAMVLAWISKLLTIYVLIKQRRSGFYEKT